MSQIHGHRATGLSFQEMVIDDLGLAGEPSELLLLGESQGETFS